MVLAAEVVRRVQSRVGTEVSGKWRLERVLGIGGMAAVYAAVHRNQNRVAIKMLHPEQSLDAIVRSRFLREGYVANSVEHEGAVRVQDDGVTDDGAAFLVMELLEGETLEDRRDRLGGRLPVAEVLAFAEQLLQVLEAAHARGVVHRDLKPDNLFLTMRGELKVLDFGIAHLRQADHESSGTSVGTFMGTPSFMPPEQARARWDLVDARSDLWAVGAVMFTLLSGHLVHEAETISEQLVLAVQTPAPRLRSLVEDVPEHVGALVDQALSYDKEHRFQSAQEMAAAVRRAMLYAGPPSPVNVAVRAEPKLTDVAQGGVDRIGDTMLAPSDSYPGAAKGHASSLPGLATPPSTLLSSSQSPRSRARSFGLVAVIFSLLAIGLAVSLWRNRAPVAERPPVAEAAPAVAPTPPAPSASFAPISVSAAAPVTVPLNSPSSSAPTSRSRKAPPAARPVTGPSSSAPPAAPDVSKKSDNNLFDKRF